jgi:hypothetical protein
VAVAAACRSTTVLHVTVSEETSALQHTLTADPVADRALQTARTAGAWTPGLYQRELTRRPMRHDLATAPDTALAEEHLYWASEVARLTELASALVSRAELAALRSRQTRARVRTALRAATSEGRPPSQSALDDAAECDSEVIAVEERLATIRLQAAHAVAAKEASATHMSALSREITLRGDAKRARLG